MTTTFDKIVDDSRYYVIVDSQTEVEMNGACSGNNPENVYSSYSAATVDDYGSLVEVEYSAGV